MARRVLAYLAATLAGAIGFGASLVMDGGPPGSLFVILVVFSIVAIGIGLAPFWLLVVVVADRLRVRSLLGFAAFGVATGVVAGPTLLALLPQMSWDMGPTLTYGGRWLNDLQINVGRFAAMGAVAGATYWLVARPRAEQRRSDGSGMQV